MDASGQIVLTTPHPQLERAYNLGARIGVFSALASEDHEQLLGRPELERCASLARLSVQRYHRFLLGANQLAVLTPEPGQP